MHLSYDLKIEQSQKLVMTPELIQAIRILQFNTQELDMYVQEELMTNPVLEQAEAADRQREAAAEDAADGITDRDSAESTDNRSDDLDIDWKEYIKDRQYDDISYRSHEFKDPDRQENSYEQYTASSEMLSEHLMIQLDITAKEPEILRVGEYIIESLDDNGYMTLTREEIAAATGAAPQTIEKTVKLIQTFDPYGVGAENLGECLMIQMRAAGMLDEIYEHLLTEYIDDIAANRLQKIAKQISITTEDLQHRIDVIRMLEPKPGREFAAKNDTRYVIPDVFVEYTEDDYVVTINDDSAPNLMVSTFYQSLMTGDDADAELTEYLTARLNSAVRLIKSIDQRKQTIWKVVDAVVKYQKDFFRYGSKHLKTLTLKQIADEVGIHESTVSRAVNGKYLQSPRGVFEIKYFFSAGVASRGTAAGNSSGREKGQNSSNAAGISSVSVKDFIKELVGSEDPKHPYSDQDMAEMLKAKGISISRRTVAKYRDEMQILSSSRRKRY